VFIIKAGNRNTGQGRDGMLSRSCRRYEMVTMQMVDFNRYVQNQRMYGGTSGRKIGIVYEGKNYILKFPGNLKEQQMKNIRLSYSNSPACEYIGSQIYALLGVSGA